MHARELVELATLISAHGPALLESGELLPEQSIEQYWTTSKVRLDRWAWRLRTFCNEAKLRPQHCRHLWPEIECVLEEILTSEMLTRVWTGLLCAYDRCRGTDIAEPVARSVLIGHMEARHRVLTLLVHAQGIAPDAAIKLNRLRRRAERWTDVLVGHLVRLSDVTEFAFDADRATEFAADLQYRGTQSGGKQVWPLLLASVRAGFHLKLGVESPNADLNARIAASILSCFPPDLFDSTGLFRSLWLMRLTNMAEDTQGKIDELLETATGTASSKPKAKTLAQFGDYGGRRRFGD
jgi:hypothetical protein